MEDLLNTRKQVRNPEAWRVAGHLLIFSSLSCKSKIQSNQILAS